MPDPEDTEPTSPYPAWGMGDLGPAGHGDAVTGRAGGSPRRVSFRVPVWDVVLAVLALLIWTVLFLIFFAQR